MNYAERNLLPNEKLIRHTYGHWVAFLPSIAGTVTALVVWFLLPSVLASGDAGGTLGGLSYHLFGYYSVKALALIIMVGVGWFGIDYLKWIASEFAITDHRVLVKHGLILRRTTELFLERVESVHVNQSIPGRFLRYGTLVVVGTGETREVLYKVPEPLEFRSVLQTQTAQIRDSMYRGAEAGKVHPAEMAEGGK